MKFFVCEICGNLVGVVKESGVPLTCCGQNMTELIPGTSDGAVEKHVPVIEKTESGKTRIKVGSEPHPMIAEHYIEFIEVISEDGNEIQRKFLHPNEEPLAEFNFSGDKIKARELCNIHGLWSKKND